MDGADFFLQRPAIRVVQNGPYVDPVKAVVSLEPLRGHGIVLRGAGRVGRLLG